MDVTHLPALAVKRGYETAFQAYDAVPTVRGRIADVRPLGNLYGEKGGTIIGGGGLVERQDGEGLTQGRMEEGYTWQIKIRDFGREMFLPDRLVETSSDEVMGNMIAEWVASVTQRSVLQREQLIASILQDGTLTAGNAEVFDQSYPGNADPNPKVIYDGQPLFSAAHPIKVGTGTYANFGVSRTLTSANLTAAKVEMEQTSAVDDRGDAILNMAGALIVPPSMEAAAKVLLNSMAIPGSANNDVNVHNGTLEPIVFRFLSDTASAAAWWLQSSNIKAIRMYDSGQPDVTTVRDDRRRGLVVQVHANWGAGVVDWRGIQANNKATS